MNLTGESDIFECLQSKYLSGNNNQNQGYIINKYLINNPDCVNLKDINENTVLIAACKNNLLKIVQYLLNIENININDENRYGDFALIFACKNNSLEIVQCLLNNKNIDINKCSRSGWTALLVACKYGFVEIVKCLLSHETIDVNKFGMYAHTPLMYACEHKSSEIVECLLSNKYIDLNCSNDVGFTALGIACINYQRRGSVDVLNLLLNNKKIDISINYNFKSKYRHKYDNSPWDLDALSILLTSEKLFDSDSNIDIVNMLTSNTNINRSIVIDSIVKYRLLSEDHCLDYNDPEVVKEIFLHSYKRSFRIEKSAILKISDYHVIKNILPYMALHDFTKFFIDDLSQYAQFHHVRQMFYIYDYYKNNIINKLQNHRLHMLSSPNNAIGLCDKFIGASAFIDINDLSNLSEFDKLKLLFNTKDVDVLLSKVNLYLETIDN